MRAILKLRWFDVRPEDTVPYPGAGYPEPRWQTLIAFRREDCVENGYIERIPRDSWRPTKSGLNVELDIRGRFASGELDLRAAYL